MSELVKLADRRFPSHVIEKLVRAGYLLNSERLNPTAVERAWERFEQDLERRIADRYDPKS
jgi:hypothetical protein